MCCRKLSWRLKSLPQCLYGHRCAEQKSVSTGKKEGNDTANVRFSFVWMLRTWRFKCSPRWKSLLHPATLHL